MSQPRTYYNTNGLNSQEVEQVSRKFNNQERAIVDFFLKYPLHKLPASRIYNGCLYHKLIHERTPLTSIRRAISNLSNGANAPLVKLPETATGPMGKPEHLFALRTNSN